MNDPRVDPPFIADEHTMLTNRLDWHRQTLEVKCQGLTEARLRERSTPPSPISLLGLVRHMASVEYARHNGHADLIRERVDGATGE